MTETNLNTLLQTLLQVGFQPTTGGLVSQYYHLDQKRLTEGDFICYRRIKNGWDYIFVMNLKMGKEVYPVACYHESVDNYSPFQGSAIYVTPTKIKERKINV